MLGLGCRHHECVSSTPLWVPLVVAGIGVAGTLTAGIAGGLITQRWSDRREVNAWTREREREHERWTREDEARTFEHRRQAYTDFYEAVKALAKTAYDHGYGFTEEPELREGWQSDAFAKLAAWSSMPTVLLRLLPRPPTVRLGPGASTGTSTILRTLISTSASRSTMMPS